jgi:6-phosphogluconate dehydrogenase
MGRSLALNIRDRGWGLVAWDPASEARTRLGAEGVTVVESLAELVPALDPPRAVLAMVPAGTPVDALLAELAPLLQAGDCVVDGGNSHYRDTVRRARALAAKEIGYLGLGVSGGEAGARHGPALMLGGDPDPAARLGPLLEAIAARVDGEACAVYLGPDGAGHFTKMLHNGIEYAEMQLIAEAVFLLRHLGGLAPAAMAEIFRAWNRGPLGSYLIEISAEIVGTRDPETGRPLLDLIRDRAGEKGTGRWAAIAALELGVAAPTLAEAVFARSLTARPAPIATDAASRPTEDAARLVADLEGALLAARVAVYAQGFAVLRAAGPVHGWALPLARIARLWRGGCIIRAGILTRIAEAFERRPELPNLLQDAALAGLVDRGLGGWRRALGSATAAAISTPALASALAYRDALASPRLWADMIQAQRDYFGRHGFERTDKPGLFHHDWPDPTP